MYQWPAKCAHCGQVIQDWADAGLYERDWLHKRCWSDMYREAHGRGRELGELRSPVDRSRQLEWPMMAFLMMFHFGLAAAVAGWFLLTQTDESRMAGMLLLVAGIVIPVAGAAGAVANIRSRRQIELIRYELETQGGWKPGR
jgi:hypothetical protein